MAPQMDMCPTKFKKKEKIILDLAMSIKTFFQYATVKCYLEVDILVLFHLEADAHQGRCKGLHRLYCVWNLCCQIVDDDSMAEIRQTHRVRLGLQDIWILWKPLW